jgi:hypothetical protein
MPGQAKYPTQEITAVLEEKKRQVSEKQLT